MTTCRGFARRDNDAQTVRKENASNKVKTEASGWNKKFFLR